jgi:hypothetical protein
MTKLDRIQPLQIANSETNSSIVDERVAPSASLIELEARLHVHRSALPTWRYHAAGRGLARLREYGFDLGCLFDVGELCQAHTEIVTKLPTIPEDEGSSLELLLRLPPLAHDLAARIRGGTAALSDALLAVESRSDFKDRGRIVGAVKALADKITKRDGLAPDQIPARLKQIEARLDGMTHADFGVLPGTFTSMRSRIRTAVRLVDMSAARRLPDTQLLAAWQDVIKSIKTEAERRHEKGRGGLMGSRAKLGRLIAFCHERRIEPAAVTDETIESMRTSLLADQCFDAFTVAQATVYAWENLQEAVPDFPAQKLSRLYQVQDNRAGRIAFESLPLAFQSAWVDFENRFGAPDDAPARSLATLVQKPGSEDARNGASDTDGFDEDPFALDEDDDSWADDAGLPDLADGAEAVAGLTQGYLRNIKSAVVHAGKLLQDAQRPPSCLLDVVRFKVVERLLRDKYRLQLRSDRSMPEKNGTLRNVATCMITVARLLKLAPEHVKALVGLRDKVDPFFVTTKRDGTRIYVDHRMGPRHKERLAAMGNDNALINWFEIIPTLHGRLKSIIDKGKPPTPAQTNDGIVLVLHAITRCCPLRRANLARITVFGTRAWLRMPMQKGGRARITVPREDVKNRKELTLELTPEAITILEFYLKHVRPVIAARVGASPDNPYLFPARGMKYRAPESLNEKFVDRNWKIGGFRLNLHCQRHLAGKIILDRDHRAMETVRQLLGHKRIKTTERYYTEINELYAQMQYHADLEQHYLELLARRRPSQTRRSPS